MKPDNQTRVQQEPLKQTVKPSWMSFETKAAELLRLCGFEVMMDINQIGRQTDIWCERHGSLVSARILVECKSTKNKDRSLNSAEMTDFCNRVLLARNAGKADFGWMITNKKVTQLAKKVISDVNATEIIKIFTLEDILENSLSTRVYHASLQNYLSQNEINFIDPAIENYIGNNSIQNTNSLEKTVVNWIENSQQNLFLLLGDYGQGKTSFCHHLMGLYYGGNSFQRIPLYIRLREVANQGYQISSILRVALQERFGLNYPSFEVLKSLSREGKLLFIFDGLDEISLALRWHDIHSALQEILSLSEGKSKILITSRPGVFENETHASLALKTISGASSIKKQSIARISYFDAIRVKEFMKRSNVYNSSQVAESLLKLTTISDIIRRPFTLQLVVNSMFEEAFSKEELSSPTRLYTHYTDRWLHRDAWRSRISALPSASGFLFKEHFVQSLAWKMFSSGRAVIDVQFIEEAVLEYFSDFDGIADLVPEFVNEVKICSFLDALPNGTLEFSHYSFFQFFVAKYLASGDAESVVGHLSDYEYEPTILHFFCDLYDWPKLSRNDNHFLALKESRNYCANMVKIIDFKSAPLQYDLRLPDKASIAFKSTHPILTRFANSSVYSLVLDTTQSSSIKLIGIKAEVIQINCNGSLSVEIKESQIQSLELIVDKALDIKFESSKVSSGTFQCQGMNITSPVGETIGNVLLKTIPSNVHIEGFQEKLPSLTKTAAITKMGFRYQAGKSIKNKKKSRKSKRSSKTTTP